MVGLVDLAPASEQVAGVQVYGVSARGVAHLLASFPDLRKLMSGVTVEADALIQLAPDAVSAIIAAGVGKPGDKDTEETADRLPVDVQADFLAAILRLTMPKGVGPFVEKLTALGGILNADAASPTARATKSGKPSTS